MDVVKSLRNIIIVGGISVIFYGLMGAAIIGNANSPDIVYSGTVNGKYVMVKAKRPYEVDGLWKPVADFLGNGGRGYVEVRVDRSVHKLPYSQQVIDDITSKMNPAFNSLDDIIAGSQK